MTARSYLYVPGDRPDMVEKAVERGQADALILDLEDAVPPARQAEAREAVRHALANRAADGLLELWVRINPGAQGLEDIACVAAPALRGFCLAKAEASDVVAAAQCCAQVEGDLGIEQNRFSLMPLLETATSVLDIGYIATSARVGALQVGEADLAAELGWAPGGAGVQHVRVCVALAAAAASLPPPVAPVDPRFGDAEAFRAGTLALKDLGYGSRACIHPAQVVVANEVFTPTDADLANARAIVEAFDAALDSGRGVLNDGGEMVDAATVRRARRVLGLRR
ncbi:CoA ester lyase [Nocardioides agariphilus]|uniref:CoA ester lyase n=1 Tax=Nocardioides agariphilus TaxID=433664 RepID=A0A930VGK7_9ACTN|nr:CoA ester lyase [Nocardioides agariphilus]MBF4766217.1 CoA ester lyase [Nocardioides agariphilus]